MATYKAYNRQSFFDIAMHQYGDASMAIHIAVANGVSVTDEPAGEIVVPVADVNYNTVKSINNRGIIPATWLSDEPDINSRALFWDGYLHPDDYLFPDSYLLTP